MKKIVMLFVGLIIISSATDLKPVYISASAVKREPAPKQKLPLEVNCVYKGITNYPPWLEGRDAPWDPNVRIDDYLNLDDQLTSMAVDTTGRIYVCYEGVYEDPAGPNVDYGFGLATSVDNGATWDNRIWGIGAGYDLSYPEIAITTDGRIWVFGNLTGGSYDNIPCFMMSYFGDYNNPDNMDGVYGWTTYPDHYYPEAITYGDGSQFVLASYRRDAGTNDTLVYFYSQDSMGTTWRLSVPYNADLDLGPSVGVNVSGSDTILIHGVGYYDAVNSDWDVDCILDSMSGNLYGWSTTNPADDRYPSVFCSNGYAYIAYQADVGGGNNDILFNYSTDYGTNWLGAMMNLTNDPANETYPRLYGTDVIIGVNYIYGANRVRFNYSPDNGQTWLSTPETITDNNSANSDYHSVSLFYTPTYWYAAWEDTRNSGTDGLELYTSRRTVGQGDITHSPTELIFNYNLKLTAGLSSEKYVIRHAVEPIDEKLADIIAQVQPDEFIPIFIMLAKQMNPEYLIPRAEQMSKPERRQFVINECTALANEDQKELLSYLKQKEGEGKVLNIVSQWTTNTICLRARPEIVIEIAQRHDIWEIGYSEPLQIMGVQKAEAGPTYQKIEFIPEDGREICWGVDTINANDVWPLGWTGAGIIVGHMDSGVNYNHLDLTNHMWDGSPTYPNHGWDFVGGDNDPMDGDGHGTQTAGIVAGDGTCGSNTGVAPDAQIMVLRIYPGTNSEMGQAISFALKNDADLLSCSIGWSNPSDAIKNWCRGQSITVYGAGIVWCESAGNGMGGGFHYPLPQDIISPADCPGPYYAPNGGNSAVIAVGATDVSDNIANFSSYGPTHWNTGTYTDYPYPPGLMKPDVAAPGVSCKSLDHLTNDQYDNFLDGTSFAQPHLAGTVALMLSKQPSLTPRQIDSIIQTTAIDIETPGRDNLSGAGRIDALLAVNALPEGAKWAQLWVINQATATGILQVTDITKAQGADWIVAVLPKAFSVPINDSEEVWVTVDTTNQGLSWGQTYYDTLLIWCNSLFKDNPERVPVTLIMATIGIEENEKSTDGTAQLLSIVPNPFKNSVKIDYLVPCAQNIDITIYDVCGKKIKTLINEIHKSGDFSIIWDGKDDSGTRLPAGVYFSRIKLENKSLTNKLILIR